MTLARQALGNGTRLFGHSPAVGIEAGRVLTPRGHRPGAADRRRRRWAIGGDPDGLAPRVRSARLQMLATAPAADVQLQPPAPSIRDGHSIALGSSASTARSCSAAHGTSVARAEWTSDARPTPAVQDALTTLLRERIGSSAAATRSWAADRRLYADWNAGSRTGAPGRLGDRGLLGNRQRRRRAVWARRGRADRRRPSGLAELFRA